MKRIVAVERADESVDPLRWNCEPMGDVVWSGVSGGIWVVVLGCQEMLCRVVFGADPHVGEELGICGCCLSGKLVSKELRIYRAYGWGSVCRWVVRCSL